MPELPKRYSEDFIDFKVPKSRMLTIVPLLETQSIIPEDDSQASENVPSEGGGQNLGRETPKAPKALEVPVYEYPSSFNKFPVGRGARGRRQSPRSS